MTIIDLHFLPHLAAANLAGTKTRTTRIKQHGKPGDIFFCQGVAFVITRIETEICRIYYPNPTPPQIYNIDCIIRALVDTGILILTHSQDYKEIHYLLNPAFFKIIEGYRITSDNEVCFDEN